MPSRNISRNFEESTERELELLPEPVVEKTGEAKEGREVRGQKEIFEGGSALRIFVKLLLPAVPLLVFVVVFSVQARR
jgi:hypothetical protein